MFFIVILLVTALLTGILVFLIGVPITVLRGVRLLGFDARIWWTLSAIVAVLISRAVVLSTHDMQVPTEKLQRGLYQFQIFGCFAGAFLAWAVGLGILFAISERVHRDPISIVSMVANIGCLITLGFASAAAIYGPAEAKRTRDQQHLEFVAAIKGSDASKVHAILSQGYDVESSYSELNHSSPAIYAINHGDKKMLDTLVENKAALPPERMLGSAMRSGDHDLVETVLRLGNESDEMINVGLTNAIFEGDRKYFDFFLSKGANPNHKYTHTVLMQAAGENQIEFVKILLDRGAEINETSLAPGATTGSTALVWAANKGHLEMVALLLERGADPNIQVDRHESALIMAVRHDFVDVVKILLEHSADVNYRWRDKTALDIARDKKSPNTAIIQLLESTADAS